MAFPLAKKDFYEGNGTVDFILSFEGRKIVPGSVVFAFEAARYSTKSTKTVINSAQEILSDTDAGAHVYFRDITTNLKNVGLVENLSYYPRFVKQKTQATKLRRSLGVETFNSIEGKTWNETVQRGYVGGPETTQPFVSYVIHPDICINKSNVPIPGNQVGTIRLRIRLSPDSEVLYGQNCTSSSGYELRNLEVRYETIPDDNTRPPLQMEFYNVDRQVIETNNANLATFVAQPTDAVHISFNSVVNEGSLTENYIRCLPLPGKPLDSDETVLTYGAERVYYAVNDTQTALVGFTMESREEITWNYLRSFNNEPMEYSNLMQKLQSHRPDGYGLGINFGTLIDFTNQKFEAEIQSQVSTPFSVYLYFRGLLEL